MKASRAFISEVEKRFGNMAFTLRAFEEEKKARMGVVECVTHKLVDPFNVLYEKEGEFVAQFKFTVLLMPSGSHKITGLPIDLKMYQSEHKITDPAVKSILTQGTKSKKKKDVKGPAPPGGDEEPADSNENSQPSSTK